MTSDQPEVSESRPSALTSNLPHELDNGRDHGAVEPPLQPDQIRAIVRLIQCRQCSLPLHDPVTLPCGRSLCRECLPEAHTRENITYPAIPDRLQGFVCPFPECGQEHALGDCGTDVILSKVMNHFNAEIANGRREEAAQETSTEILAKDAWAATGITSLAEQENKSRAAPGTRLLATYSLIENGELKYETDVSYIEDASIEETKTELDNDIFIKVKETVRTEMDCQVCYALFYDPLTTVCGHTFCRTCLHRILDHSSLCPICRRTLSISPLLHRESSPSNECISKIINTFWAEAVLTRGDALNAETQNRNREFDIPVFVCTLSFPTMPTFLHIFEPRYRLMIRRALEADRTFGMALPRRPMHADDRPFMEYGTLLRIVNAEYFADGRSLVETVGISRFRVLRHGSLDGYTVAKIERVDDISLAEEESREAAETQLAEERQPNHPPEQHGGNPEEETPLDPITLLADIEQMPTQDLLSFGVAFVDRMQLKSVPWLAQRILAIYGECPKTNAARFPWWFASILPAKDAEKYKLLEITTVRERLKICCRWAIGWESNRWGTISDARLGP